MRASDPLALTTDALLKGWKLRNPLQEPTRDPDVWPAPAPKDPQVSR